MAGRARVRESAVPSKQRLRVWLRLLKATRMTESVLRENLRSEFGSTLPRFDVMAALSQHPQGLKMNQISSMLKTSNGNITGIVNRLLDDGLVSRESVPGDRRVLQVTLTAKGQQEFARQAHEHEQWIDELLSPLSPADSTHILDTLESVVDAIEKRQ